jgi:hypothetical protein
LGFDAKDSRFHPGLGQYKNLFVLYYAGHGRINSARQAEWVFGQDLNSPFVDWSVIQGLFGTAKSDVLILLDTCAAASSATTTQFAVMETIAACGFERRARPLESTL